MDKPMSHLHFRLMSLFFKIRGIFNPPKDKLIEAGLKPGLHVVDYGCGPGSYAIEAARVVGDSGKVYAVDILPLAVETVKKKAAKAGLKNVVTIWSDRTTGLDSQTVDAVLLYDTFHDLSDPKGVLKELHRVLKPSGILSFSDHHMKDADILWKLTERDLFELSNKGKRTYTFIKK